MGDQFKTMKLKSFLFRLITGSQNTEYRFILLLLVFSSISVPSPVCVFLPCYNTWGPRVEFCIREVLFSFYLTIGSFVLVPAGEHILRVWRTSFPLKSSVGWHQWRGRTLPPVGWRRLRLLWPNVILGLSLISHILPHDPPTRPHPTSPDIFFSTVADTARLNMP